MPYTQQFIVKGKLYGSAKRPFVRVHETLAPPLSYAFFCPTCAEVWARCPVVDDDTCGTTRPFQVWTVGCERHPTSMTIPGSLFLVWDKPFNDSFPDDMVKYEFHQALKLYQE